MRNITRHPSGCFSNATKQTKKREVVTWLM
nr:MAG TPA: hypothetical protein [Caudoviricetes sp.]